MQIVYNSNSMLPGAIADDVENTIGISAMSIQPEFTKAIKKAAIKYASAVELPVKTSLDTTLYPLDQEILRKRISHCVFLAQKDGVEVEPTMEGVYDLVCGRKFAYNIMLNREEERALIAGIQKAHEIGDERSIYRLNNIVIALLTTRLRPTYTIVKNVIRELSIQDDIVQELYVTLFSMLEQFDLNLTQAGLTPVYVDTKLFNAVRGVIIASRDMKFAYETWDKVDKFRRNTEDHNLSMAEIAKKYNATPALVQVMQSYANAGSFHNLSMEYKTDDGSSASTFGEGVATPDDDYKVSELYIMLDVLTPAQREIVKLKMNGYSHQEIADKLGYESKRAEQYQYQQAKIALAQALELDPNLYSGLKRLRA